MIMELFPQPRRMTDQELQDRIDRIVAYRDFDRALIGLATAGFEREQRRRAAMTSHDRIALARSLAEERAVRASTSAANPDPIEIFSPTSAASDDRAGYPIRETGLTR